MNTIDALYLAKYNPFKYGKYLADFYSELTGIEKNSLLLPILIPLFTHPFFKTKIETLKARSSIHTIFFNNYNELYDLQDRVDTLRTLTSDSIQYCLVNEWLETDINSLSFIPIQRKNSKKRIRVAKNLAKLFSNRSIYEIYISLGIKP
ncbi:three component ABC system middle component [Neisseria mucosa]|uniref:three component ABC system middle component n=1 Tax=Neisseria mucosa TaxID=488 RepID=UPI001877B8A8|nr:three component ABC system middle component [Neisseria mucosa]